MKKTNKTTARANEKYNEVYSLIPVGQKRAITNHELQALLSFTVSDPHLRKIIKRLRYEGKHIVSSPKFGYWKPTSKSQKNKYDVFWNKHAKTIKKTVSLETKKKKPTLFRKRVFTLLSKNPCLSAQQIATKLHCSQSTAYKYRKEFAKKGAKISRKNKK